jgi:FkbM family methyltransferase
MNAASSIPVKQQVQSFLKHLGLYERLKASRVYDFYWTFVDPHWITDRSKEVEFYRRTLGGFKKGDLIFDIGANDGYKTDVFLRLGARAVAVEPDETNLEILNGKFLRNRLFPKPVKLEGKAVSDKSGEVTMWIDAPGSALNTLNPKWAESLRHDGARFGEQKTFASEKIVRTTTLEDLISQHGVPFYIKIDVEGYEVNVLRSLKRAIPYLSFEVNLPEFKSEALECIHMLREIGANGMFNYSADCRTGMVLKDWMRPGDFLNVFERCKEPVIEIFWRTSVLPNRP